MQFINWEEILISRMCHWCKGVNKEGIHVHKQDAVETHIG